MSAVDTLSAFITPLLPGYRVQFGRWMDGSKTDKYAIIKPVGGGRASSIREPQFQIILVGPLDGQAQQQYNDAVAIIEAMRDDNGGFVVQVASEPVVGNTNDGRAMVQFAVSTIVI